VRTGICWFENSTEAATCHRRVNTPQTQS
jgi:hypothetical protein